MISPNTIQNYPKPRQDKKNHPSNSAPYKNNGQQAKPVDSKNTDKKPKSTLMEAAKWSVCIVSSLAMFAALTVGINRLTRVQQGKANSILGNFTHNFDETIGKNKIYKAINNSVNTLGEKTNNLFNKIVPERYRVAIADKEFGNRRVSMLAADIFQVKTDIDTELKHEFLSKSLKDAIEKFAGKKDNSKFKLKENWLNKVVKDYSTNQKFTNLDENAKKDINEILQNLKANPNDNKLLKNVELLSDKYYLLKKSDEMSFIPKAITKGLFLFENVSNTSLNLDPSWKTANKLAFPMAFALFGTAPMMKKTMDSDAPVKTKVNTFMKDFIVNNAFGIMFFSFAGRIVNSITGLKTLGQARNNLGQLAKATDPKLKMKFYDYPLKALGKVLGLGQGVGSFKEIGEAPTLLKKGKEVIKGAYAVTCGMGIRFIATVLPMTSIMTAPLNKAWDKVFGKVIDFEAQEKAQQEAEKLKQQQYPLMPNSDTTLTTNLKLKDTFRKFK